MNKLVFHGISAEYPQDFHVMDDEKEIAGFDAFLENYRRNLNVEKEAVRCF